MATLPVAAPVRVRSDTGRLLQSARQYDPAALERVFDRSFPAVHRLLVGLLGDESAAEEVAVETYHHALDRLHEERDLKMTLTGWVVRTAYRDAIRRRDLVDALPVGGARAGLRRLPHDQREVLSLRLLGGLDAAETAAAAGHGLSQVLAAQERGLRRLSGDPRRSLTPAELSTLDRGLDMMLGGESPDAVREAIGDAASLRPLLDAAAVVAALGPAVPAAAVVERVRGAVLAEGSERRAHWVHAHPGRVISPVRRRGVPRFTAGGVLSMSGLAALAVVMGVLIAGMAMFSEPDSPAYPLKRLAEGALVVANRDPGARAQLEIRLADQRLREADAMIFSHHPALAVQAVHDRFALLSQAGQALIGAREHDASWKTARSRLRDAEAVSLDQVEQELLSSSDQQAAQRIRAEVSAFESERKYIDKALGFSSAAPASTSTGSQQPAGQATAIP